MPFIGNQPALSYTSFAKQDFTTSATTSYTLDNPVANANELALFINFVRQEPTTAYSASGTSLTLTSATSASDDMYCVYLGKAVQTVNPPNASVGTAQLAADAVTNAKIADDAISDEQLDPTVITGQTAETSIADGDTILIHDASASALRKMTKANFVSGIGGTNTPNFYAYDTSGQSLASGATTKLNYATEVYDTDNAFASSRFTVPSGQAGKYHFTAMVGIQQASEVTELTIYIYKNGSSEFAGDGQNPNYPYAFASGTLDLAVGDYVEAYCEHHYGSTQSRQTSRQSNYFQGFKLIG